MSLKSDDSTANHARLLRQSVSILSEIENYEPVSQDELDDVIDFFARRRMDAELRGIAGFDFIEALTRRIAGKTLPRSVPRAQRLRPLRAPLPERIEGEDLARLVVLSSDRAAALGADRRYLAVSGPEAEVHRCRPAQMLGRHVLEVIGCGHYAGREKQRIDLAFSGRPQDYTYRPDGPDGDAEYRSEARAVTDRAGRAYAVVIRTRPV